MKRTSVVHLNCSVAQSLVIVALMRWGDEHEAPDTSITEWHLDGDTWRLPRHSDTPHVDRPPS